MTIDLASTRTALDACPLTDRAREAVDGLLAEVERLRAIESPVRALEDRNGDVWVLDVHPPRYKRDHYSSPMPRDFIEKHYGPAVEVKP